MNSLVLILGCMSILVVFLLTLKFMGDIFIDIFMKS